MSIVRVLRNYQGFDPVLKVWGSIAAIIGVFAAPAFAESDPTVLVASVEERQLNDVSQYSGQVYSAGKVGVVSLVQGFLGQLHVQEGSMVSKGDTLFDIVAPEIEFSVQSAKANLALAEAEELAARNALERASTLRERGTLTIDALEDAQIVHRQAIAELALERVELNLAQLNLERTTVTAPIDGRLGHQQIPSGSLVGLEAGTIVSVIATDPMRLRFSVPQRTFVKHQVSASDQSLTVSLLLADGSVYDHDAELLFVGVEANVATDSVTVFAEVENPDHRLFDGQLITVKITETIEDSVLVVPRAALLQDADGPYVYTVNDDNVVAK